MITAQQARTLYENSQDRVDEFAELISKEITRLAPSKREYSCYLGDPKVLWEAQPVGDSVEPTVMQELILQKFSSLGFGCVLKKDGDPYVPRGLAQDDGDGPSYINVCMVFRW